AAENASGATEAAGVQTCTAPMVVYTASATDLPDAGHPSDGPSALTFSLGSAGGDEGAFTINGTSGKVTLTGAPNFEAKASYSFEIGRASGRGRQSAPVVSHAVNK